MKTITKKIECPWQAHGEFVIVKLTRETETKGGIYIPENVAHKNCKTGVLCSIGSGVDPKNVYSDGNPTGLKIGDTVRLAKGIADGAMIDEDYMACNVMFINASRID